jgi:histidine triad (HIT) family protein
MMNSHAPLDYACPLCRVAAGNEDNGESVVWRDDKCVAAVALHQNAATYGSLLVLPIEHHENIYTLPDRLGAHLFTVTKRLALALKASLSCAGVTVRQNNEPAGEQDVWHYHVHVTPRYGDSSQLSTELTVASLPERRDIAARVRRAIGGA